MASTTKNLGIVAPVPAGEWEAGATYQKLNIVRHSDGTRYSSFMALQTSTAIEPDVTKGWESFWQVLVRDGIGGSSVVQEEGQSTTDIMSQKAVTDALQKRDTQITQNTENITANSKQISQNTNKIAAQADLITALQQKSNIDDIAIKTNQLKIANLEQALNGYVLDTADDKYSDLDTATLNNAVTISENVYPIADGTRALVSKVEGKTAKMVQLLDKSTYYATSSKLGITATNNGDGSWTINGTATEAGYINFSPALSIDGGHKVLLMGNKPNSAFSLELLNQRIKDNGNGAIGKINAELEKTWGIAWASGALINNVTIIPQLFDLTAMNREDITTVEQFKAEYPDFYPYEDGNIYTSQISGVTFYQNQDKTGNNDSVSFSDTYELNGIGDAKDYLEITTNEDNELYTLKKVQNVGVYAYTGNEVWAVGSDDLSSVFRYYGDTPTISFTIAGKGLCNKYETLNSTVSNNEGCLFGSSNNYIYLFLDKTNFPDINSVKTYLSAQYAKNDPVVIYYRLSSPVETVIATNLTYEQVTAIRNNGGLIEVNGNTNKGYARPTINNTVVYRLTATKITEVQE